MSRFARIKAWARDLNREVVAVYFAARDPRTPLVVRLLAVLVAAYALSPIDLIPDAVPVLGYVDDLVLVPLGLALVVRLVPPEVMQASRAKAAERLARPRSVLGAVLVVSLWAAAALAVAAYLMKVL